MMRNLYAALMLLTMVCLGTVSAGERFETIQIANGLAHAERGDWVLFKMGDGKLQKHSVTSRSGEGEDAEVTIQIVDFSGNTPIHSRSVRQKAGKPFVEPPQPGDDKEKAEKAEKDEKDEKDSKSKKRYTFERRKENVNYDGSQMEVTIVDVFDGNSRVRTWYLSTEFPVYGVIKRMSGEKTDFELLDYGVGDTSADPYLLPKPAK